MRVGFAGTPDFAVATLAAILDAGHTVPLCLTQPDRPKGRGLRLDPSPVKRYALAHGLRVEQPPTLRAEGVIEQLRQTSLDVLVVAAYGLILPSTVLAWPRFGGLNVHASLLPRWRGAAPIQRAIEAGDRVSGVTIMRMEAGLDTGPMLATVEIPIGPADTAGSLHDRLAVAGAKALVEVLAAFAAGHPPPEVAQPAEGVTYAAKIGRDEAEVDWTRPADAIECKLRAFDPFPGAQSCLAGQPFKLWRGVRGDDRTTAPPGTVIAADRGGLAVACGDGGVLRIVELQPAGGRRMPVAAWLAGHPVPTGERFAAPAATDP